MEVVQVIGRFMKKRMGFDLGIKILLLKSIKGST